MKNYKKIYLKLIKEIKDLENSENDLEDGHIDSSYVTTIFKILNEIKDEVSGEMWHNQVMSEKEFKQWKKQIKISNTVEG